MSTESVRQTHRDQLHTDPLRNSLRDFRLQTQRFGKVRDEQVAKASRALKGIEGSRMTRAGLASCQKRVEELAETLARLKRDNDASEYFSPSSVRPLISLTHCVHTRPSFDPSPPFFFFFAFRT